MLRGLVVFVLVNVIERFWLMFLPIGERVFIEGDVEVDGDGCVGE